MADRELSSPELLRQLLDYDPLTGYLTWRWRSREMFDREQDWKRWNKCYAGTPALSSPSLKGYRHGHILGKRCSAHHAAWAISHGVWPKEQIDHINGSPGDNRLVNLRQVSNQENLRNQPLRSSNTSGFIGVGWNKATRKWYAKICVSGKTINLGQFVDIRDAVAARKRADADFGFHENHGRPLVPGRSTPRNQV